MAGFFFNQSNISRKNLKRLTELTACDDHEIREMAEVVLAVGKAHPGRKHRVGWIRRNRPDLWQRMLQLGLAEEWPEELVEEWRDQELAQPTHPNDDPRAPARCVAMTEDLAPHPVQR